MKLEYCAGTNSMGSSVWVECNRGGNDRTEEFLSRALRHEQALATLCASDPVRREALRRSPASTRDELVAALEAGVVVQSGDDWDDQVRCGEAADRRESERQARAAARPAVELVRCDCGHRVPRGSVMSASLGSSCPECYDRMSH